MTAPVEPLALYIDEFYQRYYVGNAGFATAFPEVGVTDWPTAYWTVVPTADGGRMVPAIVMSRYQVAGVIDRTVTPPKLLAATVVTPPQDATVGPSGVEGFESFSGIYETSSPAAAIALARQEVEV